MDKSYKKLVKGKVILITGGTGSFGNTVVETLLSLQVKKIIIFSRDEKKQFDMRNKFDNPKLKFIIGDIRDKESIDNALRGVDFVFHAAALKQVPTCEFFPMEAVKTNILGAQNVISSAIANKVKRVVVLSTDKAVYPINAIGISKAMMEKIVVAESKNHDGSSDVKTILCGVRYGNVLYTRGSVIPHFVSQIKQNKKLTVTDFNMTRFLLPLDEAVDLVLYALVSGERGHIYVRKSPASTLKTLSEAVCQIFAYKAAAIETGIRAGEKMHETLVTEEELQRVKETRQYFKIPPESQGLDYNKYFLRGSVVKRGMTSYTSQNTKILNVDQTIKILKKLPEIQRELQNFKQK